MVTPPFTDLSPEEDLAQRVADVLAGQKFDVAMTALVMVAASYISAATDGDFRASSVGIEMAAKHMLALCSPALRRSLPRVAFWAPDPAEDTDNG